MYKYRFIITLTTLKALNMLNLKQFLKIKIPQKTMYFKLVVFFLRVQQIWNVIYFLLFFFLEYKIAFCFYVARSVR